MERAWIRIYAGAVPFLTLAEDAEHKTFHVFFHSVQKIQQMSVISSLDTCPLVQYIIRKLNESFLFLTNGRVSVPRVFVANAAFTGCMWSVISLWPLA